MTNPTYHLSIVDFMQKQVLPTVSTVNSQRQHDQFLKRERTETVLMGYFDASDDKSRDLLAAAAEKLHEDYPIGVTSDSASAQAAGVSFPAIVLYKPDGEGTVVFDKAWEVDAIKEFAKTSYKPLIGETGSESWRRYVSGSDGPTVFIFHKTDDDRKRLGNEFRSLAKKHQGAINFATAEVPDFQGFAGYLHLNTEPINDVFPSVAIFDGAKKKKYPYDPATNGELNERNVGAFIESYLAGRLRPTLKSQPIPTEAEAAADPVTNVAALNFDQVVMDGNKDVLLYYHREDCPYCRAMNAQYEALAIMYNAAPELANRVTIAKMDINKNDLFEEIPYVPFIRMYKAGDKSNAVTYSGDRSVKDLVGFVKDHGTHKADALTHHGVTDDSGAQKVIENAAAAVGGGQKAQQQKAWDGIHEQPLQGRTPVRHIHDEL